MPDETRLVRTFAAEISEGDGRTLDVRIVPYNTPTEVTDSPANGGTGIPYMEEWLPGVFGHQERAVDKVHVKLDGEIVAKDVLVNFEHQRGIGGVVGRGQSIWDESDGAYGTFRLLETQDADKVRELVRDDVLTGVSLEAVPRRTVRKDGIVQRVKADLKAIALCRRGAFKEAGVLAQREEPAMSEHEVEVLDSVAPEPVPSEADLALARLGFQPLRVQSVTRKPWSSDASRFTDEEYEASCLIVRDGDGPVKERCSLPILEPNGDLNAGALQPAALVLSGARAGLRGVSQEAKATAARKLIRYFHQAEMDPPDSLRQVASR